MVFGLFKPSLEKIHREMDELLAQAVETDLAGDFAATFEAKKRDVADAGELSKWWKSDPEVVEFKSKVKKAIERKREIEVAAREEQRRIEAARKEAEERAGKVEKYRSVIRDDSANIEYSTKHIVDKIGLWSFDTTLKEILGWERGTMQTSYWAPQVSGTCTSGKGVLPVVALSLEERVYLDLMVCFFEDGFVDEENLKTLWRRFAYAGRFEFTASGKVNGWANTVISTLVGNDGPPMQRRADTVVNMRQITAKVFGELERVGNAEKLQRYNSLLSALETPEPSGGGDKFEAIEKLHGMLEKGIITQEEFDREKAKLLG